MNLDNIKKVVETELSDVPNADKIGAAIVAAIAVALKEEVTSQVAEDLNAELAAFLRGR